MRITVNLSIYFHDHRSLAKIFINKKMQCIKDVEYHISEIFNIQNFYLKCQNVYLPPTEDVQILSNDDIVWVIPMEEDVVFKKQTSQEKSIMSLDNSNTRKDSGRDSLDSKPINSITVVPMEEDVEFEKQTSKKKHTSSLDTSNTSKYSDHVHRLNNPLGSNKNEDATSEDENINVASLVHTFEKKKHDFSKQLHNNTISPNEKKINIVKTIIISNNKNTTEEPKPTTTNIIDSDLKKEQNLDIHNNSNNENNVSKKVDEFDGSDCSSTLDMASVCNSTTSEIGAQINRRKRKRTRRRKRPENNKKEFNFACQQPVPHFVPKPLQVPTHLRFDLRVAKKEMDIPGASQTTGNTAESEDCPEHDIVMNDSLKTVHGSEQTKESTNGDIVTDLESPCSDKAIENCILKQPITQHSEPKIGNVIAFKILRVSENYTPEVSSTIVGKVMEYNTANKEILFEIAHGRDQCIFPRGRFSLDDDEDEVLAVENARYQCLWSDLLEPRLLYP